MTSRTISELEMKNVPSAKDELILYDKDTNTTKKITVASLPNLIGIALKYQCESCGSRGDFDSRGNCGSCGAPIYEGKR